MMMTRLVSFIVLAIAANGNPLWATPSVVDDLPDLTGGVVPVVQYKQLDSFSGNDILTSVSEVEYTVKVKNQTGVSVDCRFLDPGSGFCAGNFRERDLQPNQNRRIRWDDWGGKTFF